MAALQFDSTTKPTSKLFVDLTGLTFGRLTVESFAGVRGPSKYWNARCACGSRRTVAGSNLTTGKTRSCGCLHSELTSAAKRDDLTGKLFGRLTAVAFSESRDGWAYWDTVCDCGSRKVVSAANLKSGQVKSCGCLAVEMAAEKGRASATHGGSYTPEYRTWRGMKDRCSNPKNSKFDLYGGRGIRVCERWVNSFENFLADVGRKPSPHHSIDRYPNGDGSYEPGNVRWATASQQNSNRRTYTRRRKA